MVKYIDELKKEDLKGKRVLLRLDLNAPILDGEVVDTYRLERIIPTIDFLREKEARTIIISHCAGMESSTLLPMLDYLRGFFPVDFCPTYFTPESIDKLLQLEDKGVLLFENIRVNEGEEKNDEEFAKKLSQMADIYVNDAFPESHRRYASIVSLPKFLPHYAGLVMKEEIEHLSKALTPERPFVFVLGGAKFEVKFPLIKKYLEKADFVFVGGAIANDLFKEKGFEVGLSLLSLDLPTIKEIIKNTKLIMPVDVTVRRPDDTAKIKAPDKVLSDEYIADVGPETIEKLEELLSTTKTVVWNGPLGKYRKGFRDKSEHLAEIIAKLTEKGKMESIVGGGDTLAAINMKKLNHKFSFISTGGGAMMDYLVNETLPGIEALEK
ncbi:MAG TPA: phosphoglycerate kinase [Candidatus Paceibacterota bacterium]